MQHKPLKQNKPLKQRKAKKPAASPHKVQKRNYNVKHTHFHTWKPESKSDNKNILATKAQRHANRIISTEQFKRAKQPFDYSVFTKQPLDQRKLRNPLILKQVNNEELDRLTSLPRETVPFKVGDRIAVTALLSMTEAKTQVYKGTVVEETRGRGLYSRFTLRNNSDGGFYEVTFPYWSPFLRKIEMVEVEQDPIVGKKKLKDYYRALPVDHPKSQIV